MNIAARTDLRTVASIRWPTTNHKGRLRALAKLLPEWTERRIRSIYNAESGVSLRAEERADIDALKEEANRNEFQALEARLARLEAALFASDEEFHQPQMAGYRQALHGGRGDDEPGAVGRTERER